MAALSKAGISIDAVTTQLLHDGIRLFADAFNKLLDAIQHKMAALLPASQDRLTYRLPAALATEVSESINEWQSDGKVRKLWAHDATLWTGADESRWLGWLAITDEQLTQLAVVEPLPLIDSAVAVAVLFRADQDPVFVQFVTVGDTVATGGDVDPHLAVPLDNPCILDTIGPA